LIAGIAGSNPVDGTDIRLSFCCDLLGSGLCDKLITCAEEQPTRCGVSVCDLEYVHSETGKLYVHRTPNLLCCKTADMIAYKNAYKFDKINMEQTGFTASSLRSNHFTVYEIRREFKS